VLRHFRTVVLVRTLLLAGTLGVFAYLMIDTPFASSAIVLGVLALAQIISLVRYVERTNSELSRFLYSIRYDDFSQSFTARGKGRTFDELAGALGDVMKRFRETRAETEEQHQYLQTVIQHIGMGLIAFTSTGEVTMLNTAAKRLLNINTLKNVAALDGISPGMADALRGLEAGKMTMLKLERENELIQLAVYATEFKLRERHYILVSLQNIRSELEEKEMEAYQKLIRVLTHEIMNSVTPISSLASSVDDLLRRHETTPGDSSGDLKDVRQAIETIRRRSQGLLHFVEAYRNLTRVPKPRFRIVGIRDLLHQIEQLISAQHPTDAALEMRVEPSSLEVTADPDLIEQVLLNLLLNALHAVKGQESPRIIVSGFLDRAGHVVIDVTDNGPGISEEVRERIFIPFFTTKKEGSGIGLSLCKEIMRQHRGSIHVLTEPGKGATFRLIF